MPPRVTRSAEAPTLLPSRPRANSADASAGAGLTIEPESSDQLADWRTQEILRGELSGEALVGDLTDKPLIPANTCLDETADTNLVCTT